MFGNIVLSIVTIGFLTLTACATTSSKAEPENAKVITQPVLGPDPAQSSSSPEVRDKASEAGLWKEVSARNLFQDLRAYQVGDLVTINIVETSSASKKASTQSARESSIDAGIDNLLGWEGKLKNLTSFGKSSVRDNYDNTTMFKGSLKNSFDGSGSTSRDESMTASITARVIDVKPNGNLFIKGSREVKVNNETQFIILSGLIRPVDISPDNTVLSSYIGDAKIEYISTGSVSDKQRPGWLARAVDFVWPF
jgi:flagellar L-ring protein precursor FlgH